MKLVCVFLLQILLLIATHTVSVYSNFMETLVTFFKASSMNRTAFDLKKFIDNSDEHNRFDAKRESVKFNLIGAGKHENRHNHTVKNNSKDYVNKTNSVLLQLPKDSDSNLITNNSFMSLISDEKKNHGIEDNITSITLPLPNDTHLNLVKNDSMTSRAPNNYSKKMDEIYDFSFEKLNVTKNAQNDTKDIDRLNYELEEKVNVATPFSVTIERRVNLMQGNSFQDEQRNENKDYVIQESSSSSSRELPDWREEFKKLWKHKKFEAINYTRPGGDNTNMLAARPWGVMCGDPAQHDMPWGNCMLAMECEPEWRIYRGDVFCGRTTFVCCAIQLNTYDMYQDFDISFPDKDYSTDSEEARNRHKSSREKKKREIEKEKRKRAKAREKSTLKIRKNIKKIIKEIRKILNKEYRNGTRERKKRTRQLKRFIAKLKKQYKKDRKAVKVVHERDMLLLDTDMANKLGKVKVMNNEFMRNETFRDIVVNGSITKEGARMLLQTYPELAQYVQEGKRKLESRRSMTRIESDESLLYDITNDASV